MGNHNCHANLEGGVKCWGLGENGQLGNEMLNTFGDNPGEMGANLPFVNLGAGLTAKYVVTGSKFSCAHLNNDKLKCWGENVSGQLGLGSNKAGIGGYKGDMGDNLPFVDLGTDVVLVQVATGIDYTCTLFDNKRIKCFGTADSGETGYERTKKIGLVPADMGNNLPFVNFGAGVEVLSLHISTVSIHSCVILTNQRLKCWGFNDYGQLGTNDVEYRGDYPGTMGDKLPEVNLGVESKVRTVSTGFGHTCVVRIDEVFLCFGSNDYGMLGIGSDVAVYSDMSKLIPIPYDLGKNIKSVVAAAENTCILLDDNVTLKCVGNGIVGALGTGNTNDLGGTPDTTYNNISAIDLGAGNLTIASVKLIYSVTYVVFSDNSLKAFGSGSNGKLGYGNSNRVGDGPNEMGSNLPFVAIFGPTGPTLAPTKKPTSSPKPEEKCDYPTKEKCEKDKKCTWAKVGKKKSCVENTCSSFTSKADCENEDKCKWKKKECRSK